MRFQLLFAGVGILALGIASQQVLDRNEGLQFLAGAATLGGGLMICGLFTFKSLWHGVIGGGVVAMLGAWKGLGNLAALPKWVMGERARGAAPLLESAVGLICILLLVSAVRCILAERIRRMHDLAED